MSIPNEILRAVKEIRPLSQSAVKLLQLSGNPNHTADEVIRIVMLDSVLTAHILRVANSAAFSFPVEIASIQRAIPLLGEKMITGIALGISASHIYQTDLKGYDGAKGSLWWHSLRTAISSRELAPFCREELSSDLAYTAGLLHDIGKSIISFYLEQRHSELLQRLEAPESRNYLACERELLGTDHAEVGEALAARWKLPSALKAVIAKHHDPAHAPAEFMALTYTVHLGDLLSMMGGTGTGTDSLRYELDGRYKDYVKISIKDVERIALQCEDEYDKARKIVFNEGEEAS